MYWLSLAHPGTERAMCLGFTISCVISGFLDDDYEPLLLPLGSRKEHLIAHDLLLWLSS